ncbi:Homoserine kinase [Smittium mucronatum]|uniref:Homoserine kinase n=1 Tax=Smittium mucronatum TaxID=133383 RepID=A0A1R0GXG7_9FUNG|nr:Homoserine kinase [Smittium mucronatum]
MRSFKIIVPGTSANMGPGFDTLGVSLSKYLRLFVQMEDPEDSCNKYSLAVESNSQVSLEVSEKFREADVNLNSAETHLDQSNSSGKSDPAIRNEISKENLEFNVSLQYLGIDCGDLSCMPSKNLITQVALYVMQSFSYHRFPVPTKVVVENEIPLSRGLGSSAAAIISGVMLANEALMLNLTDEEIKSFCLVFECHPDNTTPAIVGGITASFVSESSVTTLDKSKMNSSIEDLKISSDLKIEDRVLKSVSHIKVPFNKSLKAVVAIPRFELSTQKSRSVLPKNYEISDVVYNFQRLAVLITSLGQDPLNHKVVYESMKDRIHQPYRKQLVPGLSQVLDEITFSNTPGLAGICLSGAGPTTIAFCTENSEDIAAKMKHIFDTASEGQFETEVVVLDIVECGSVVEY